MNDQAHRLLVVRFDVAKKTVSSTVVTVKEWPRRGSLRDGNIHFVTLWSICNYCTAGHRHTQCDGASRRGRRGRLPPGYLLYVGRVTLGNKQ